MAKDWAKAFYRSKAWIRCRDGYMQSQNYICERCGDIAVICHHKTWLTPANIDDHNISLNWEQCESLCQTCHNQEHHSGGIIQSGLTFTADGNLIMK